MKQLFSVPTLSAFISTQPNLSNLKSNSNFILTPSFAKSLYSSKSADADIQSESTQDIQPQISKESASINNLIKLEETINGKPAPFTSSLKINPLTASSIETEQISEIDTDLTINESINTDVTVTESKSKNIIFDNAKDITMESVSSTPIAKAQRAQELYNANLEWWQSQFDCLRPTLMPQSVNHPELSRNADNCRISIFSKPIAPPSQSGYGLMLFDENKYIQQLLDASCNLWTLMHVCSSYYRSFNWNNAHLALLKITTELSGRYKPCSNISWIVYNELLSDQKTRLLFQKTMQHLYWLTGETYVYNKKSMWKGYSTVITSLHWCYLILNMDEKQISIAHNTFLLEFIQKRDDITVRDLCYLLSARIEGGLFNKGISKSSPNDVAYVSNTSQAIFDRLFQFWNPDGIKLNEEDVSMIAEMVGSYLVDQEEMDIIDRFIHSFAKYPDLIALNNEKYSYKAWSIKDKQSFLVSQFFKDLLLSMERKLLVQRKSDGILSMMTRITNNILLIHNHYNLVNGAMVKQQPNANDNGGENHSNALSVKEWSQLFYDNFDRLTVNEALVLLETLMEIDKNDNNGEIINWELMTKLSFTQFNLHNLVLLTSNELTQLLRLLMDVDKKCMDEISVNTMIPASLIQNIESIISDKICKSPNELEGEQIILLEQCLDYFKLNKTNLRKAQEIYIRNNEQLRPHWNKFYTKSDDNSDITIDEWWSK